MGTFDALCMWFCDFTAEPPRYLAWLVTPLVLMGVIIFCAGKYFFSVSFPLIVAATLGVMLMNSLPPVAGLIGFLLLMGLAVVQVWQAVKLRTQVSRLESELEGIQCEQNMQGTPTTRQDWV